MDICIKKREKTSLTAHPLQRNLLLVFFFPKQCTIDAGIINGIDTIPFLFTETLLTLSIEFKNVINCASSFMVSDNSFSDVSTASVLHDVKEATMHVHKDKVHKFFFVFMMKFLNYT